MTEIGNARRAVIDLTGYRPPAPTAYPPCGRCGGTDHRSCVRVLDTFTVYTDDGGEYHRREPDPATS